MDVKPTFLNENLEEEVYMIKLEGYTFKEFLDQECILLITHKSMTFNSEFS